MKTLSENMSSTYKAQLDEFLETNYKKLLYYASFHTDHDETRATELLHEMVIDLYEGRRVLDFNESPLSYCQYILRGLRSHQTINRQERFEEGVLVEEKSKVITFTPIRQPDDVLFEYRSDGKDMIQYLHNKKCLELFPRVRPFFSKRCRWVIDRLLEGKSYREIHALYEEEYGVKVKYHTFCSSRGGIAQIIRAVRWKMQALLQDDPSSDREHQQ